jgi:glycogen synthase
LEFSSKDLLILKKEMRRKMEKEHSWDKNVEKLAKIYEELI